MKRQNTDAEEWLEREKRARLGVTTPSTNPLKRNINEDADVNQRNDKKPRNQCPEEPKEEWMRYIDFTDCLDPVGLKLVYRQLTALELHDYTTFLNNHASERPPLPDHIRLAPFDPSWKGQNPEKYYWVPIEFLYPLQEEEETELSSASTLVSSNDSEACQKDYSMVEDFFTHVEVLRSVNSRKDFTMVDDFLRRL